MTNQNLFMKKSLLFVLTSLMSIICAYAQGPSITGKVIDEDGIGLPGVTVFVKGTDRGTITDEGGLYSITADNESSVLEFSYVGYLTKEEVVGSRRVIDLSMAEDAAALSEVVVVGYGTQKKSQLTGAITQLNNKQITEMPLTNLAQALQGRAAGVDISQSGSKPGSSPRVLIRGRRSFRASNDPLYVVDGIPLSAGYEDLNPSDIQNIEVLKDATATAIYGARGANGVILVTTKRGAVKGKTQVNYDTYFGQSTAIDKVELFTGEEFAEYVREAYRATSIYKDAAGNIVPTGKSDPAADAKVAVLGGDPAVAQGIIEGRNTQYQDLILKTGMIQNHSLGVQGGNEKTKFYVSAGYFSDYGVSKGLDYTRYSLRANIDHSVNSRLKFGLSSYTMHSNRNGEGLNPWQFTLSQNPLGAAYDKDGKPIFAQTSDALLTNPLHEVIDGAMVDNTKRYRMFNSLFSEVKITDGLSYRVNFGPDFTLSKRGRFSGALTNARKLGDPTADNTNNFGFNWTLENIVNFTKKVGEHNFNLTGVQSIQKDNFEQYSVSVQGVPAEPQQYYNLGNASSVQSVGSNLVEWTINSFMGRLNYDYKNKYLLTATMRRDGSSRFGANTKWGNFPGIAFGWNLTEESFLKNVSFLDQLKLRAGWGSVGNQAVEPYQTQGLLSRTTYAWDNTGAFGYRPNTIGNPDLRWESSATANIGLDFSILQGKIQGSLELYDTKTTALLLADQLPGSTGFGAVTRNVGETNNKGIELGISTINVNTGGFKWSSDIQFTKNKEAIVSLYNGAIDDLGNRWFIGQPLNSFFDYKKIGIWQLTEKDEAAKFYPSDNANPLGKGIGQIKVQDTNADGVINDKDRVILGSDVPDFSAGLTNRFEYKNIDLSFFLFGRFGNMILSGFHRDNNALAGRYQQIKVDYWTPNNPTNEFPRPFSTQERPVYNSTLIYFDGTFIKLRNVNFGYTLPNSLASKLKMENLRLYSSIQQPKIWSEFRDKYNGVDPEAFISNAANNPLTAVGGGTTPATRVFTIGLNARF
jgi:TonB-linked SusC/RagA family outer membrane protein